MPGSSSADNGRKARRLKKIVRYAVIFAIAGALALFGYFCPFRSLLPAQTVSAREEGELRLHFLNGQGDCTLVEFPDGDLLVIDGGDGSLSSGATEYIKGLHPENITVISTSPALGRAGGLAGIVSAFDVNTVYLPAVETDTGAYHRLLAAVRAKGCKTEKLTRYGTIARPSGAYLVCLSPYSIDETDAAEASAVLYLQYAGVRVLLCSDMTQARERRLLREYSLDRTIFNSGSCEVDLSAIDVLKVAARGRNTSSCKEWLSLLEAKAVVVSCGRGSGTLSGEVVKRLQPADVYRTDELGTIIVSIRDGAFRVITDTTE